MDFQLKYQPFVFPCFCFENDISVAKASSCRMSEYQIIILEGWLV